MSQTDVYQLVTNRIIELLEAGVVPWQQPWTGTGNAAYSRVTGKHYSLLNQLLLDKPGEWLTFKQIEKLGGHVNQGEESKVVVFWKMLRITETDDAGEEHEKTIPFLAHYHVFYIDQTTGITPLVNVKMKMYKNADSKCTILESHSEIEYNLFGSDRYELQKRHL